MNLAQNASETAVNLVIEELVKMRRTFTGRDVFDRIHNKHIRRSSNIQCGMTKREVSLRVRKLFNTNKVFSGYGSTLAATDGPVVFFALPHHAKVKIGKIEDELVYGN